MPESDFERRLATLLRQTAAEISPELDVSARVHHQILSGGGHGGRRWIAVASMAAVVALLIGTFAWFHGIGAHNGVPATSEQIALHVDAAYADATATVFSFHITGPRTDVVYGPADLYLTDSAGDSLHNLAEGSPPSGTSYVLFPPLPQPALQVRQTLTLTATHMDLQPLRISESASPTFTRMSGLWQAHVTVTPVAGTSTPLQVAAQTHSGLSIQPLRLDVSPGSSPPGTRYLPGGLRIVLRMSGLTPGSSQFPMLSTAYSLPDGGSGGYTVPAASPGGLPRGQSSLLSAAGDLSTLPAFVFPLDAQGVPQETPTTVGADGSIELELIYQQPRQGPLTLQFDTITLSAGETTQGPWVFPITGG